MQTIASALHKGGSGKTTLAFNLGYELAQAGQRVLLIDFDPQANLTTSFHVDPERIKFGTREGLLYPERAMGGVLEVRENLCLLPTDADLSKADASFRDDAERFFRMEALLAQLEGFNLVLIDCPPAHGFFTSNALYAADWAIVPLETSTYALRALEGFLSGFEIAQRRNPGLAFLGIVISKYDTRPNSYAHGIVEEVRKQYGKAVFETVVPINISVARSTLSGGPVGESEPRSAGAKAYRELAREVLGRIGEA